jgi:hypothetical protein
MIKIELINADNGVIKKVKDVQTNEEWIKVYEIDPTSKIDCFPNIMNLLADISDDLGLDLGSDFDPLQINFSLDWGSSYKPTIEEVDEKIKSLKSEIKELTELKKASE